MSDLEEVIDVESDCEGDLQELGEETRRAKEDNKEPVCAVFIIGSFSAYVVFPPCFFPQNYVLSSWKSLFFYRCTDQILFAPLKSQGTGSRLECIRENTVGAAPPPCSPKSTYVLATLVRLPPTKHFTRDIDVSILVGNQAPPR